VNTPSKKLNIAVAGSGGREHAILRKLRQSPRAGTIYALPGNGGIARDGIPCVNISPANTPAFTAWCLDNAVDFVVVTPDNPLAAGLVDALSEKGILAFGPVREAAKLEWSKAYAKNMMRQNNIPTADYAVFTGCGAALEYAKSAPYPLVVKADGLALGKGVVICGTYETAEDAIRGAMEGGRFGESGKTIVLEEYLCGPEVSVLSFCDGKTIVPMVSSMDHKRELDGDLGDNTGGMGAIAPNPFYTEEIARECYETIFLPTLRMTQKAGTPFKGCLYFGLMLTSDGPKVIEYNCRFGDPETQAVLPLLESDLLEIMLACAEGRLTPDMVKFRDGACACLVLASNGYPRKFDVGFTISGLEDAEKLLRPSNGAFSGEVYCAGVRYGGRVPAAISGKLYTSGGRVLGISAAAADLQTALSACYAAAGNIKWRGIYYRRDIGQCAFDKKTP
jgi:phosphoribosylamine--glycine ligase